VESLRQDAAIHEIGPATEIEFPGLAAAVNSKPDQSAHGVVAALPLLWERRRWISRVAAFAFVISTVVVFLIPKEYESSVSIMPPGSLNGSGAVLAAMASGASPQLAAMAGGLAGNKGSGALFVDLFRSRSVQERVVARLNLQKVYGARYLQDARKRLNSRTDVIEDRKSGVISVTVTDKDPQRAHDIAQTYVEELNRLVSEVSTSSARRERIFIEQRLTTAKSDLEDAEKQFSAFASKNSTPDIKEQAKAMVESAGMLQGQLIAFQAELQSLEQIYTDNNVRVRSVRARVDELKRQLQKLQGKNDSVAADATQSGLTSPTIRQLPLVGVEWADLERRLKIQETVYELLCQQYELARIQEAKEIPTVNVVDPANMPEKKSFPPRLLMILALTMLSVAGAAVRIIGTERWERVDPRDPGKVFAERVWRDASDHLQTLFARLRQSGSPAANAQETSE
jgi:uncharacterized protein involved in exopolysaccharide biosynthesis